MSEVLRQALFGGIGTVAFALLFGVPRKYYLSCGLTGGLGWLVYAGCLYLNFADDSISILFATLAVALLSRILSVCRNCPSTVFLTTGIFPLVPGAGIFWTAYYFVANDAELAGQYGFSALKAAASIVIGIVIVFQLPNRLFHLFRRS